MADVVAATCVSIADNAKSVVPFLTILNTARTYSLPIYTEDVMK